jgi:hypothetical protein
MIKPFILLTVLCTGCIEIPDPPDPQTPEQLGGSGAPAQEGGSDASDAAADASTDACSIGTFTVGVRRVFWCRGDTVYCCGQSGLDDDYYRPVCVDLCEDEPGTVAMTNVHRTSVKCVEDVGQCLP